MEGGAVLCLTCFFMGLCTYVMGTLPLAFHLSRQSLRKLELWGAGLLLGAALTVVIPEGISNVYRHQIPSRDATTSLISSKDLIAVCLLSGFLLMFIVDQQMIVHSITRGDSSAQLSVRDDVSESGATMRWQPNTGTPQVPFRSVIGGLLGVLVHAGADGVAMGSSVESSDVSLRVVVILAIMVHKAPASIGICTLLMARQLPKSQIRLAVLVFAVTTPIFAFLTYGILQALLSATGTKPGFIGTRDIGAILSFSGGTFLYVSIHAVMELASPAANLHALSNQRVHHPHDHDHPIHAHATEARRLSGTSPPLPSFLQEHPTDESERLLSHSAWSLVLVVLGSVVPRLLQLVVGHDHDG